MSLNLRELTRDRGALSFPYSRVSYIYGLCEPDSEIVRYIGKADIPHYRYTRHLRESKTGNTPKKNWIRKRLQEGRQPEIVILATVPEVKWRESEINYVNLYKSFGAKLVNYAPPGEGGMPQEVVDRVHKGKKLSVEQIDNLRRIHTGRKCTKETIAKMKAASPRHLLGTKRAKEIGQKVSKALKGKRLKHFFSPVTQCDLNGKVIKSWSNITDAAKATGATHISTCARGITKTSGGFKWEYNES